MEQGRLVIVSHQDPGHMTGGQGVVLRSVAIEAAEILGNPTLHISMRLKGESSRYEYASGRIEVKRISVSDSDQITTPYQGTEATQYKRRLEFNEKAVSLLRQSCKAEETLLHLNGFYSELLIAREFPEYRSMSCYHLLLSKRLEATNEGDEFYWRIRELELESLRASRLIHLCSPGMKDEIMSLVPEPEQSTIAQKIVMIPNGVEDEHFDVPPLAEAVKNRVLAWGRIAPEKGFEHLFRIMPELPEAELILFGRIDDSERTRAMYNARLASMAAENSRIHLDFRPDGIRGQEKIALIDASSVVVVPSTYEPFGIVILEAMARGKPVITTATAGAKYIMQTEKAGLGDYGFLVELKSGIPDQEQLIKGLQLLLGDPSISRRLAENGRRRAGGFHWQGITEKILTCLGKELPDEPGLALPGGQEIHSAERGVGR